jgi:hypothetical protein
MLLYYRVLQAWGDRKLRTRGSLVKLVEQVAEVRIPDVTQRAAMAEHVMAYFDELHMLDVQLHQPAWRRRS